MSIVSRVTLKLPARQIPWQIVGVKIRDDAPIGIDILDAQMEYEGGMSSKCKATKIIKSQYPELYGLEVLRLKESRLLDKKHFILGQNLFFNEKENIGYFCYEDYHHNLFTFKHAGHDDMALKRVIRDFVKALVHLHRQNKSHGNIAYFNLVIRDQRGFIAGGIGLPIPHCYVINICTKERERITNKYAHDATCFATAIKFCYGESERSRELNSLIHFLQKYETMDSLWFHPYILDSTRKRDFLVAVNLTLRNLAKRDLVIIDYAFKRLNTNHVITNWVIKVQSRNHPALNKVLYHGSPSRIAQYSSNGIELVRFYRNLWLHASKNPLNDMLTHCDALQSLLEGVLPGFVCVVHELVHVQRGRVKEVFI